MAKYKLTKGNISRIRTKKSDVEALVADGYTLDGEVDKDMNLVQKVDIPEGDELDELREELVSLGCPKSTAARYKTESTLLEKIAEFREIGLPIISK